MWLLKNGNNQSVEESIWEAARIVLGLDDTEKLRDTGKDSPTFGNLVIPDEVTNIELSTEAVRQFNELRQDVNDLTYVDYVPTAEVLNPNGSVLTPASVEESYDADGNFIGHNYWTYDSTILSDKLTIAAVRKFIDPLLVKAEMKWTQVSLKSITADKTAWKTYHAALLVINADPITAIGSDYPTVPFNLDWGTIGMSVTRVMVP